MIAAAKHHLLLASPLTLFSIANFIINWRGRTTRHSSTWHTSTRAQVSCLLCKPGRLGIVAVQRGAMPERGKVDADGPLRRGPGFEGSRGKPQWLSRGLQWTSDPSSRAGLGRKRPPGVWGVVLADCPKAVAGEEHVGLFGRRRASGETKAEKA